VLEELVRSLLDNPILRDMILDRIAQQFQF
jgi:hypothetical protein